MCSCAFVCMYSNGTTIHFILVIPGEGEL
uniref:Uncharacterized protein n=1 Tax=Anguilla anguilla TaxID=7936 RepID=A0A0E9VG44_ANGAN